MVEGRSVGRVNVNTPLSFFVFIVSETYYSFRKKTADGFISLVHSSRWISDYHKRHYATRTFTRMKFGPVFILGVVGGNSSASVTWDHFKVYGMLDKNLYGQKEITCCLKYREKDESAIIKSGTISEKRFHVPADMWTFHVGCLNVKHAQGIN